MQKNSDITILLTLRGRHLHTLRWLWHANQIDFPYHVIIADGEVHPAIDRILSDSTTFPKLSYEYHRYTDKSYFDFYKKCVDASNKIHTKYVMMSDNDDYPIITGIEESINYLNSDVSYVAAGGRVPSFSIDGSTEISGKVFGKMRNQGFHYAYRCHGFSSFSVRDRVLDQAGNHQVLYYHVYRTQQLKTIFEEIQSHNFSDLTVHEYFSALRTATLGKVRTCPSVVCYFRQQGTSSGFSLTKDWVHHMLHSNLPKDFRMMAESIANLAEGEGSLQSFKLKEDILDSYAENLRHLLGHTMMRHRFPRLFRFKQKLLWLRNVKIIPAYFRQMIDQRKFLNDLATECRDQAKFQAYKFEFSRINASLSNDSFLAFVRGNAPDLLVKD